jgi:putative phosphoribosyl transferase
MKHLLKDRKSAGQALAGQLKHLGGRDDVLVLALPRGGVPVALAIAAALGAPLDLMLVRKLGVPGQEELAMGAIASGGIRVVNREIVTALGIREDQIDREAELEYRELERRQWAYRGDRPLPEIKGRTVILVDDGIATGATMKAAIKALRQQHPAWIITAVPVAPADTVAQLRKYADEVVCPHTPEPFMAIGRWYGEFSQLTDEEVRGALQQAWSH